MRALRHLISLLLIASLGACAATPPRWRPQAFSSLNRAAAGKADQVFPAEYNNARRTLLKAEEILQRGEQKEAEKYFFLAQMQAELVREKTDVELARRGAEEAARRATEEKRLAEETRAAQQRAEEEAARLLEEKAAAEAAARAAAAEASRKKAKPPRERVILTYTVRRGESLPLIAAQPDVYNDRNLWPLLYRANRDQISDPRHIWPGQVLRVPRNYGRDDVSEARRYAMERPLH